MRTQNFGMDLSKIGNLHDLFNFKMKTEGLSEEDVKMMQELEHKRFNFEKNEFLKTSDIRAVIDEGMEAL